MFAGTLSKKRARSSRTSGELRDRPPRSHRPPDASPALAPPAHSRRNTLASPPRARASRCPALMAKRPLSRLSLPSATLAALTRGGFESVQDLAALTPERLAHDLAIPLASSQAVFDAAQAPRAPPATQSAAALAAAGSRYSTHCAPLDRLLGGGLRAGYILELAGPPGCGKEALAVHVVRSFVAASQDVLFVDMQNMTSPATLDRLLRKPPSVPPEYQKHVQHMQLYTLPDLLVFLRNLPACLQERPRTALLVLSSLSFPFQSPVGLPIATRNAALDRLKHVLTKACTTTRLTVVITSQLATKLLKDDGSAGNFDTGSKAILVPQLGSGYLPSGRTYRVVVIPHSRSTGVVRLLSSPTYVQGRGDTREEQYEKVPIRRAR
ncbi:nucleoside triphosphate hydrolase protein [Wolfiporia cocos MD-104 SS10]|uniref:Nucleoside triphosphate hydrolase protein n=1 Tax=Wolfiporia cocos (strain MD-104) TaxID=742152 RepID=A0A2H3J0A9_WOLCO|nr:nucleoside triphosphate hydrolase protein [Wolfiporia cocos MD-104 SS10]